MRIEWNWLSWSLHWRRSWGKVLTLQDQDNDSFGLFLPKDEGAGIKYDKNWVTTMETWALGPLWIVKDVNE